MTEFVQLVSQYKKAIAGALVALSTWFATSFADGDITAAEVAPLPFAILAGLGVVAIVKNAASPEQLEELDNWKNDL